MDKKYTILIIDENLEARSRLREVCKAVSHAAEIGYVRSTKEARMYFQTPREIDVVFVSSHFSREEISELIVLSSGATSKCFSPTVIVVLHAKEQDALFVSSLVAEGVKGFICDPYSTESLAALLHTTGELSVLEIPESELQKASLDILFREVALRIDRLGVVYSTGQRDQQGLKALRKLHEVIAKRYTDDVETYQTVLTKVFSQAKTKKKEATSYKESERKPRGAKHPGQIIEEVMVQRGITKEKLVSLLKWESENLDALLSGTRDLDEHMARDISRALGRTADFWLSQQRRYAHAKAHPSHD